LRIDQYRIFYDIDNTTTIKGSVIQFSRYVPDHVWHHRG